MQQYHLEDHMIFGSRHHQKEGELVGSRTSANGALLLGGAASKERSDAMCNSRGDHDVDVLWIELELGHEVRDSSACGHAALVHRRDLVGAGSACPNVLGVDRLHGVLCSLPATSIHPSATLLRLLRASLCICHIPLFSGRTPMGLCA